MSWTKDSLIAFENRIADRFDDGELPYLVHLSGGNEEKIIEIFKEIKPGDWIFSTHRNHYHYLLAGGDPDHLENLIAHGKSMFVFDRKLNFYSSSIVAGAAAIAAGVAWALRRKESNQMVWCFLGDGAGDEGNFYEAARYVDGWNLPCTFIVEDNDRSVSSNKGERWGDNLGIDELFCVRRYIYTSTWPHSGTGRGKWIEFKRTPMVGRLPVKRYMDYEATSLNGKYKNAIKESMEMLAKANAIFVGYNVRHGSAYGTLSDVPEDQRIETPVAENLMAGLAMGMSLEGFRPVLYFERHDFIYNAMDALVNQLDKIETLSDGQFLFPVIIRAVVGGTTPFYAGPTHTSDLTWLFEQIFSFPVIHPINAGEIMGAYEAALGCSGPVLISERRDLYE